MNPTLTVLLYSSIAAFSAALGVLPLLARERTPATWLGWANALAAGLMLGAAYMLGTRVEGPLVPAAAGAVLGILFLHWTHATSGTADLDLNRLQESDLGYEYQILLTHTLHSAMEGVAIGVAMVEDLSFGILMALAITVHNIPEATVLAAVVRGRGVSIPRAALIAVATNVSQILLSVAVFAVVSAAPGLLAWAAGFAAGALVHLVLVELLPESYREAGSTSIALVALVALGVVVGLTGLLP